MEALVRTNTLEALKGLGKDQSDDGFVLFNRGVKSLLIV